MLIIIKSNTSEGLRGQLAVATYRRVGQIICNRMTDLGIIFVVQISLGKIQTGNQTKGKCYNARIVQDRNALNRCLRPSARAKGCKQTGLGWTALTEHGLERLDECSPFDQIQCNYQSSHVLASSSWCKQNKSLAKPGHFNAITR